MARELRGWKEIGAYLGVTDRTAQRWEAELRLPVHRVRQRGSSPVYAFADEIDAWRRSAEGALATAELSATANEPGESEGTQADRPPAALETPRTPAVRRRRTILVTAAGLLLLAAVVSAFFIVRPGLKAPKAVPAAGRGQSAGPEVHTSSDSPFVITLRITADDGDLFSARSVNGASIFVTPPSHTKYGLAPSEVSGHVEVTIYEVTMGGKGVKGIQTLLMERGVPQLFNRGGDSFRLEWVASEPAPAKEIQRAREGRMPCGMQCGRTEVQAFEVLSSCGSCCDPDFAACSRTNQRRP